MPAASPRQPSDLHDATGAAGDSRVRSDTEWFAGMLRRRWWVIALVMVGCTGVAVAFSASRPEVYTSRALVKFESPQGQDRLVSPDPLSGEFDAQRAVATVRELLEQPVVMDAVVAELGNGTTRADVADNVEITANSSSDLVSIRATGPTPAAAQRLANTYAKTFVDLRVEESRRNIYRAVDVLQDRLASSGAAVRSDVREQISQLEARAALGSGSGVGVAAVATTDSNPIAPRPVRDGILAAFLGAILGLGIALLWHRLDDRIREASDVEAVTGLPIIAEVPRYDSLAYLAAGTEKPDFSGPEFEAHRMAWTQLRFFLGDRRHAVVAITSTAPGEGKTTSAECLAASAALLGHSVALVDSDLRRPTLASRLGVPGVPGLSDVVVGNAELDDALRAVPANPGSNSVAYFDLLPAGAPAVVPSALLAGDSFKRLIDTLSERYEVVIIDNAPAIVADVMQVLRHSDAAVLVTRPGVVRRRDALAVTRLFAQLPSLRAAVIVNALSTTRSSYSYYGGYEHYGQIPDATRADEDRASEPVQR